MYRRTAQSFIAGGAHNTSNQLAAEDNDAGPSPTAMRIYQTANLKCVSVLSLSRIIPTEESARFLEIIYDQDARDCPGDALEEGTSVAASPFSGAGLLLDPLQFNEQVRHCCILLSA